jgi:hypothetical protein
MTNYIVRLKKVGQSISINKQIIIIIKIKEKKSVSALKIV